MRHAFGPVLYRGLLPPNALNFLTQRLDLIRQFFLFGLPTFRVLVKLTAAYQLIYHSK